MSDKVERWSSTCLLQHADGFTEVVFSDGSAVTLHANPESITYFRPGGTRLCLLASCVPRSDSASHTDDLWSKVATAFQLRNRYCRTACIVLHLLPDGCARQSRYARLRHVEWQSDACPSDETVLTECSDGTISVVSHGSEAKLVLSSHGRSFTVQWWCPQHEAGSSVKVASMVGCSNMSHDTEETTGPHSRLFAHEKAAAAVLVEHAWVEQLFPVADEPQAAWTCPLLMALRRKRSKCAYPSLVSFLDHRIRYLEVLLQQQLSTGLLIAEKESGLVTASYPIQQRMKSNAVSNDSISPAACLGTADDTLVRVLCRSEAVTWLHEDAEVTILARAGAESSETSIAVMTSRQHGRFWTVASCADGVVQDEEVLCAEVLPMDASSKATTARITEARKWLRHNDLNASVEPTVTVDSTLDEANFDGWLLVKESTWPSLCTLSLFATTAAAVPLDQKDGNYLVRVLFADRVRMSFLVTVPPEGWATDLGNVVMEGSFGLVDSHGQRHERSFRLPIGCELYVDLAIRALRHVYAELQAAACGTTLQAIDADVARIAAILAEQDMRRCSLLCSGSLTHGSKERQHNSSSVEEVLRRNSETCKEIAAALAR
mmetsp:Transcript_13698/g.30684  ORF Transcript_13698/g.30684 Transcript_13698/m.30684 type:complete len:604 (+) Transcript_13698:106-1917(+)